MTSPVRRRQILGIAAAAGIAACLAPLARASEAKTWRIGYQKSSTVITLLKT
ncbi:MAG TPA: hypothetical protein PLW86_17295 [Rhodocyclaceae bacterium]|nr:hypothetical protein [Rhodocyclaceae bacterium]